MDKWVVVEVFIALLGVAVILWRAAATFTTSVNGLKGSVDRLSDKIDNNENVNTENHRRIWCAVEAQGGDICKHTEQLQDHEMRIHDLEKADGQNG